MKTILAALLVATTLFTFGCNSETTGGEDIQAIDQSVLDCEGELGAGARVACSLILPELPEEVICIGLDYIESAKQGVGMFDHCLSGDTLWIEPLEDSPYSLSFLAAKHCEISTIKILPARDDKQNLVCVYAGTSREIRRKR